MPKLLSSYLEEDGTLTLTVEDDDGSLHRVTGGRVVGMELEPSATLTKSTMVIEGFGEVRFPPEL